MPLRFDEGNVVFEGACMVEEALGLAEHWRAVPPGIADLSACTYLHTALLQVIAAAAPAEVVAPADPRLARWIMPVLSPASPPGRSRS
ncbi:hypothetical protein RHODGE_RHODGE_00042 [Rhodoplanes serenus]|uniref:Uncharacterized protein n=1 Tax=Rhodoplanes serenus TaxID=200615 RepID=A0A447CP48_9BRAD|nr:hypothetical protein [Rhodoplanes serenus]VCU06952.1 hypothetical protein RHODGE_RHODGE_00042 [Rhodoplanes serenus]